MMTPDITEAWPAELREAVFGFIEQVIDGPLGYEYADNVRVARVGNAAEEAEYEARAADGCCGNYDEVRDFDGVFVMIGFNYGH